MKQPLLQLFLFFGITSLYSQLNIDETQWNSMFPKRAGLETGHPQGYTTDFFSYNNFIDAVNEMGDYTVTIRKKNGVWGERTTVTKKSTSETYVYSDVDSWWYTNTTPETVIYVDFADFVQTTSTINNKRELAAFLANISKETTGGWQLPVGGGTTGDYAQWGLYYVHELGYNSSNGAGTYSDNTNTEYPPNPSKGYYGRGPIQLSWNYNYGQFSKFLYNDKNILLDDPDQIQQDGKLAFKSAIWFWMMPQCPKPSCHQVMHDLWQAQSGDYSATKMYKKGFAHANNIINGGLECRNTTSTAFAEKVIIRSELYKYYLSILGFTSAEISQEDSGAYSTLCFESTSDTMENYINCAVVSTLDESNFSLNDLKFYPNPVSDNLTISYLKEIIQVDIYSVIGEKIFEKKCQSIETIIDTSFLQNGIYFIKIIDENNSTITLKIMKK